MHGDKSFWRFFASHTTAIAANAKVDLLAAQLNEHKVAAAREFATLEDMASAESPFANALDNIRSDIRDFASRLDKLLVELIHKRAED